MLFASPLDVFAQGSPSEGPRNSRAARSQFSSRFKRHETKSTRPPTRSVQAVRFVLPRQALVPERYRALEQQSVNERLRQIATQLALRDVELLGEDARRSTGRPVALEPPRSRNVVSLLRIRERQQEPTEEEGSFRLAER